MKFQTAPPFEEDLQRLTREELALFRQVVVEEFVPACDAFVSGTPFPKRLRVKPVRGAPGVFEITWSSSGPDGRTTFDWAPLEDGSPSVRWRRVGRTCHLPAALMAGARA